MRLPVTEVYDRYYDKLTEKDLNRLNEMMTGKPIQPLIECNGFCGMDDIDQSRTLNELNYEAII